MASLDAYLTGIENDPPLSACPLAAGLLRAALEVTESETERLDLLTDFLASMEPGQQPADILRPPIDWHRRMKAVALDTACQLMPVALRAQADVFENATDDFDCDWVDCGRLPRQMARIAKAGVIGDLVPLAELAAAYIALILRHYPSAKTALGPALRVMLQNLKDLVPIDASIGTEQDQQEIRRAPVAR